MNHPPASGWPLRLLGAALLLGLLALLGAGRLAAQARAPRLPRAYTRSAHLMGSHFTFTAVSADDSLAWRALRAGLRETQRIDHLFSYWDSTSQVVKINRSAGIRPVVVDQEVYDLIARTLKISQLSGGPSISRLPAATKSINSTGSNTPACQIRLPCATQYGASVGRNCDSTRPRGLFSCPKRGCG